VEIDTNVHTLRDNWGQFADAVEAGTADAMRKLATEGERLAAAMGPPALARTFSHWATGRLTWSWGSDHQWAEGLNDGIPSHWIGEPGQVLVGAPGTGRGRRDRFRARGPVLHPGVIGSHFMERSFEAVEPDILPELRDEVSRAVRGF